VQPVVKKIDDRTKLLDTSGQKYHPRQWVDGSFPFYSKAFNPIRRAANEVARIF
jgi:hypothetical protein